MEIRHFVVSIARFRWARSFLSWLGVGVLVILLAILFTPLVPYSATRMAVDWYDGPADVVVVLAGATVSLNGQNFAGEDTYLRTLYACSRVAALPPRYVIVSGASGGAAAMARLLRCQCPGKYETIQDDESRSTRESAVRVQQIVQHLPAAGPVVLVTSDYHCFRASRTFLHAGLRVRTEPVPDIAKRSSNRLYRVQAFAMLLIEIAKTADYKFRGWI